MAVIKQHGHHQKSLMKKCVLVYSQSQRVTTKINPSITAPQVTGQRILVLVRKGTMESAGMQS